jgi:tol-pal system protein YbgF
MFIGFRLTGLAKSVIIAGTIGLQPLIADVALAQSSADLVNRISRLEAEISDLQRHLFAQGGKPAPVPSSTAVQQTTLSSGSADPGATSAAARAEIRLQQLEAQMRNLTGKVEELDFKISQAVGRVDKLVADLDRRLAATGGQPKPEPGVAPRTETAPTAGSTTSAEAKPGVLGYLKESDLRAIEAERREDQADAAPGQQAAAPTTTAAPSAGAGGASGPVLADGDAASRYKQAFSYLMRHDYDTAEKAFREFVTGNASDPLAGNAMYWLGETYYVREQFAEAAVTFAEGYEKYPGSPKTADNLLKLGFSLARLNRVEDACVAFAQLSDEFPNASTTIKRRALNEGKRIGCKG